MATNDQLAMRIQIGDEGFYTSTQVPKNSLAVSGPARALNTVRDRESDRGLGFSGCLRARATNPIAISHQIRADTVQMTSRPCQIIVTIN